MKPESQERFVDAWGAMGALWGINRSVARVHALLMASDAPLSLDEIAERLSISKGNASMSLHELRGWGVIRPVPVAGDRRDYYVTEPDVWMMFFRILQERKRREFDPALRAVQGLLDDAGASGDVRARLEQMSALLTTMEGLAGRFLKDPSTSRTALSLVAKLAVPGLGSKRKKRA
ncbi:MAG: MarR family transcriptional regulator [Anaeromyxobacteraceae bacterium]